MSQAEALLNSLTDEQIAAYSVDPNSEPHIVIGSDRFIIVPEKLRRIAVQYDHDVETVIFDCPRYWDNLDMSKMAIYINYMRSDKYKDSYPVSDVETEDDIMHFSWTISRNVTEKAGQISFLICIKKTDTDGNEVNHWNSELCQDMYVSAGMETEEQPMDMYPDLITQLLLRMDDVEEVAVTKEEIDEAKDICQEASTNVTKSAAEIRNSYANAVKKYKTGAVITANDVSPLEHDVKVKVRGKNLIPYPYRSPSYNNNGITCTNNGDGSITLNGTATNYVSFDFSNAINLEANVTYTMSLETADKTKYKNLITIHYEKLDGTTGWISDAAPFTWQEGYTFKLIYLNIPTGRTFNNETLYPMLEEGSVATEYEPYIDPTTVTVTGCGKNLVYKPYSSGSSYTINGVTFTEQNDGSVIVNGTPTGAGEYLFKRALKLPPGRYSYRLFGVEQIASLCSGVINQYDGETWKKGFGTDKGTGLTFEVTEEDSQYLFRANIYVYASTGGTVNNVRLYPMLCVGDVPIKFEQVLGATYTPDSNGICMAKSVSPNMTIFTNNGKAIVEAEYNQDQHKVLGDISAALDYILELQDSILGGMS